MQRIWIVLVAISFLLLGCSLDATIMQEMKEASSAIESNRSIADYVNGETVMSPSGYQVRGAFGEVSERSATGNGWQVEAVFYE